MVIIAVLIDQSRDLIVGRDRKRPPTWPSRSSPSATSPSASAAWSPSTHVSLDVYPGEVVGLLGDNGAGKSTLIKCVSGVYQADEGEIFFGGERTRFTRPIDARANGIETIYQDLALANNLDVPANIFLGREMKLRYLGGLVRTLDEQADAERVRRPRSTRSRSISPPCRSRSRASPAASARRSPSPAPSTGTRG